ncbi:MAG: DUF362 domain-containing protein [Candidatus Omnitrophica bacterium]|nr:DUF362 domain-containing protein [Candidatus Omnitrophota bacterium]MBU1923837.1 DUF362 domain-containing protein [Candidatus Omnitrophota bacterium]
MKSKVYFISVKNSNSLEDINGKLKVLLDKSRVLTFIPKENKVAVKVHFGEEGNTGFVRPAHLRVICDEIASSGGSAFLSDANTLYRGRRLNSEDHLKLAYEHEFTKEITGVDVIIPDDTKKENIITVEIKQKLIKSAKLVRIFIDTDALVAVSHFKGHILTGFGGALKNIGMGCATREGKLAQHCNVAPVVHSDRCIGCGECEIICPASAVILINKKSEVASSKCIGCASCLAVCPTMAMFIDFNAGEKVQYKMAEYALAVLKDKKNKAGFINFAVRINKECDCWDADNPRIAPDIGILASNDPVSIDKASFDLVNKACGKNIFKAAHPEQDGMKQLKYAQEIGLGNLDYELIEL